MTKVENMRWSVGLYCENSLFCGLGMDLQTDYERPSQPEISPVTEVCDLLVNRQMISCETVLAALYDIKILRVSDWTCLGQGFDYCERERLTACEDVLGGFFCRGCLQGTQPDPDNDGAECGEPPNAPSLDPETNASISKSQPTTRGSS
ncbi:uncharacterized protein LOC142349692 [Convolutriloba macropyga]|uniref:uncharacterized protein LOC142349692 n=1 Tax=Convolutriloba macropyga TaxID=536237 RepID=UPI003F51EC83